MPFVRTKTAQAYEQPRYSHESAQFNQSARDYVPMNYDSRRTGRFDGVKQGLSCREPMRQRNTFGPGRLLAGSHYEDEFYT